MQSLRILCITLALLVGLNTSPAQGMLHPDVNAYASAQSGPSIDVWYTNGGSTLTFGQSGWPQARVNVLGRVINRSDETLWYRLNPSANSQWIKATLGFEYIHSDKRLEQPNDFNIELFDPQFLTYTPEITPATISSMRINERILQPGPNQLELALSTGNSQQLSTPKVITIQYTPIPAGGPASVPDRTINWSGVNDIFRVAQPIDGLWELNASGLRVSPANGGFDRIVGLGDLNWRHYQVKVSFTAHEDLGNGNVGVIANFTGHLPNGMDPMGDWKAIGAFAYYSFYRCPNNTPGLVLRLAGESSPVCEAKTVPLTAKHWLVLQAEPGPGSNDTTYRMKHWVEGESEPQVWDHVLTDTGDERLAGSVLLVAHNSSATFHTVQITNLDPNAPTPTPVTATVTATRPSGTATQTTPRPSYPPVFYIPYVDN